MERGDDVEVIYCTGLQKTEYVMSRLSPHPLPPGTCLARPDQAYEAVTPDDPATAVMTDLRRHRAVTISASETIGSAERLMVSAGVRLLFVLDGAGAVIGLVTYRDLASERALAAAVRERTAHEDLQVGHVMTPAAQIEALDLSAIQHTHVRDLVELMRKRGRQHALVTESDGAGKTLVRGIFSITQIGRQLGVTIEAGAPAQSFAEIEHLIAHA